MSEAKSGGKRKHGRDLAKCKRYRDHSTREKHKIKRILQSSGVAFAKAWARERHVEMLLDKILRATP